MTDRVQIVAVIGSVGLLLLVLELVRRRRLSEEYSALWILSALVLIGISWRRDLIDSSAAWLGVYYPPAVLLLVLVGIVAGALLWFSVILSRHQRQIDRLIEENAIAAAELRELRDPNGQRQTSEDRPLGIPGSEGAAISGERDPRTPRGDASPSRRPSTAQP